MDDVTIGAMDKLPVYRKCSNCSGHGHFEMTDQNYSSGGPFTITTACFLCGGSCIEFTGRYIYHSRQGYVVEDEEE